MLRRVVLVRAIYRNISEDEILHSHRLENLKYCLGNANVVTGHAAVGL
jgi:hypothetical protein